MTVGFVLAQLDPATASHIARIGWSQVVIAVAMGLTGLAALAVAWFAVRTLIAARNLIRRAEQHLDRLAPRAEPLIERVTLLATDARDVSDNVRRRVKDLTDTVADVTESIDKLRDEAESRVRDFGAVLDVVQTEAERLLLDTAATAHGVSVTAESLRRARDGGAGQARPRSRAGQLPRTTAVTDAARSATQPSATAASAAGADEP